MILSLVSMDLYIRDKCRYFALGQGNKAEYFEPDFQPAQVAGGFWAPKEKVPYTV